MILLNFSIYEDVDNLKEITSPKIYISTRHEKFHPDGLYSETIFGPTQKYKCQCGKFFGKMNDNEEPCDVCGVLCTTTDGRTQQFAKITFPEGIFVMNPNFKTIMQQIYGQSSINSILSKNDYINNRELPYFFSKEKGKLTKRSKMKASEDFIDFPVYDITSLKNLFDSMKDDVAFRPQITSLINNTRMLDFIFMDYILVIPPSSRQIIKISPTKTLPHPITKNYSQILKNKSKTSGISDQLFKSSPEFFGYTVYKYQQTVDEVYSTILELNFQKKESYIREALTGKTIEFSQRAVLVPNPALRPYQVGMHSDSVKKLFLPELMHFLYTKYQDNPINDENFTILDFVQYIYKSFDKDFGFNIKDEDFREFLQTTMKDFRFMVERQPTLWRYNMCGYTLANVYDDNDILPVSVSVPTPSKEKE